MALQFRRLLSKSSSSNSNPIVHSNENLYEDNISSWSIPHQTIESIYKIGVMDFKTAFSVRSHEETLSIQEDQQTLQLLSPLSLAKYVTKGYRYIHFGLIQVALKPLARKGIDTPVFLALRDNRLKTYRDSLIAIIQTNICNGPIYFNSSPNHHLDITDPRIVDSLVLDIKVLKNNFKELSKNFAIIYRIHYRLLTALTDPKCIVSPIPKGQTTLLQYEAEKSTGFTPKLIKWKDVTIPESLEIQHDNLPENIRRTEASEIIEKPDGKVLIRFGSLRGPSFISRNYSFISSRNSYSGTLHTPRELLHRRTNSIDPSITVDFTSPLPQPHVETPSEQGPDSSPTHSDMETYSSINVIINSSPFEIDKPFLRDDFDSKQNKHKRAWFMGFDDNIRDIIRKTWYNDMDRIKKNMPFFDWFNSYLENYEIRNAYRLPSIEVVTKLTKTWNLLPFGTTQSVHPPLRGIKIVTNEGEVTAEPFKNDKVLPTDSKDATTEDIKKIFQQNNYSNQILHTIASQVNLVHEKISHEPVRFPRDISKPHFQVQSLPKDSLKHVSLHPSTIIERINQKLEETTKGKDKVDGTSKDQLIQCIDKDEASTISTTSDNDIQSVEEIFNDEDPELNKLFRARRTNNRFRQNTSTRNYYPRPTPPDLQFEERSKFKAATYDGHSIYEWNVDGMSEGEVINTLQEMGMANTAYKCCGHSPAICVSLLISGFTGQLKNWWDNSLTIDQKEGIINYVNNEGEQEPVYQLIYTISMHFIGNPNEALQASREILSNLRCRTLSDYRWYKDVFLSYVFKRPDCNNGYWKERFVSGLPTLFAERINLKIKEEMQIDIIPWKEVTYGQLTAFIKREGLALCSEIKLQAKYGRDKKSRRKELGNFCESFGLQRVEAPSIRKKKHERISQDKRRPAKRFSKPKTESKPFSKPYKSKPKRITCYKCGKIGHKANECTLKQKINEICQDNEELRSKLINLLIKDSSDEELEFNSDSDSDRSGSTHFCQTISEDNDRETLFQLIDNLDNPTTKREYFLKLKHLLFKEQKTLPEEPFSLTKILNQRPSTSIFSPVTTKDLQTEVNTLKREIKTLYEQLFNNEAKTLEIETRLARLEQKEPSIPSDTEEENLLSTKENEASSSKNFISTIDKVNFQKWYIRVTIKISDYSLNTIALLDSGADLNCISEGLIPSQYYQKTKTKLLNASGDRMGLDYRISNASICNSGICFKNSFVMIKELSQEVILGTPFLTQLYPFKVDRKGIHTKIIGERITFKFLAPIKQNDISLLQYHTVIKTINAISRKTSLVHSLSKEIIDQRIEDNLKAPSLQSQIKDLEELFKLKICSDSPTAFWERKQHQVSLPYEKHFHEIDIPTKARPIQMNSDLIKYCKEEIESLLNKGLIRSSKSPWSCAAFYVNNQAEKERGVPRLVINYKPLNKALQWIRYPLPNKRDLLNRLYSANIFSKFDMKSGFWQIQIKETDRYKTAFTVPFGHYEWNVMPFGLKNAPSEFQRIMNDIFNPYSSFSIVYIDDVLIFSKGIKEHFEHLKTFLQVIEKNGLAISAPKMKLFQTNIRFLGHDLYQRTIKPINRSIEFASKFLDEIKDKNQLQGFWKSWT